MVLSTDFSIPEIPDHAYPSDVLSEAQRERWRVSRAMATVISAENEPSRKANSQFVFFFTRTLYESDIPTGSPDDPIPDLVEGVWDDVAAAALEEAQVDTVLAELDKHAPGDDDDEEKHWEHVGKICDVLDGLLGTPDDLDAILGEYVGRDASGLEEGFAGVLPGRYDAKLHPRDRAGRWSQTLHAMKAFAHHNAGAVRDHVARKLKRDDSEAPGAARLRARATAAKASKVAKGAAQQAVYAKRRSHIAAVNTLGTIYGVKAEEKLGLAHENVRDPSTALETFERAKTTREALHKAAEWAVEHHEELKTVLAVAKHVSHAVGVVAADDSPADGPELEEADLLVEDLVAV